MNESLLLIFLLWIFIFDCIANIILGLAKQKRSTHYETGHVILGIIFLIFLVIVLVT